MDITLSNRATQLINDPLVDSATKDLVKDLLSDAAASRDKLRAMDIDLTRASDNYYRLLTS